MNATEFVRRCKDVALNYKTTYVWGGCGMPITSQTIADKVNQYPLNRTSGYEANAKKLVGYKDTKHPGGGAWMFDCVCLLKSILWGWKGEWNKYYGGAVYASNGVPDVSADGMISLCKDVSTDFSSIAVGEALWLPGHIGVYIGDGLGIECTPAFLGGVQITAVGNIAPKSGYATRTWRKHGKMPYVQYDGQTDKNEVKKEEDNMDLEGFKKLWGEMRKQLQDNDSSAYSKDARDWAVKNGIITGNSSGSFNGMWEDFMTREQFVTVLYRFAKMIGKA